MQKRIWENLSSFYLIGIGGVSMSGLAKFLLAKGKTVAGSDACAGDYTAELIKSGIKVSVGNVSESIAAYDAVIYTDAIREDNRQLAEAKSLKKTIFSRGQFLYEVSRTFKTVVAISGCHGKTTCTAMLAHIFAAANKQFCAHIGGRDKTFSNTYYCGNSYFLTEACEYKKNFLLLKPDIGVVLNSDADHLECYGNKENLTAAYRQFLSGAGVSVAPFGDKVAGGITFGYSKNADYHVKNVKSVGGFYSFMVCEGATELGSIKLSVYGKHNVLNALAAIAVARSAGIPFNLAKEGITAFSGVERRFEIIGTVNGAPVIADYAHHPNELRATIKTAKKVTSGRLFVVFQPHTYSRTKNLFKDFVKALSPLNNLLVYRTFAAREYFDDAGSALTLSQSLKKSKYADDPLSLSDYFSLAKQGDTVLVLGAGDIYDIAKSVLKTI